MKKYQIIWTEFAVWNLDQIYDYTLTKSFSENIASKLINGIVLRVEQIELQPNSGQQELELLNLKRSFRYLVYKNYKIIYFIESSKVYVTDVFHCKISPTQLKKRNL